MLEKGMKAPEFSLPDAEGKTVSLTDFRGTKLVLYFYPKDNTPGCTRQACAFAREYSGFVKKGVAVVGVSRDKAASHQKFSEKYSLPFTLLSDPDLTVTKAYGAFGEKKQYGKVTEGVLRTTFIIDENGVITEVMPRVKPDTNASDVLAKL